MKKYIAISVLTLIIFGCVNKTTDTILEEAQSLMNAKPDNANLILDKIKRPEQLTPEQQMKLYNMKIFYMSYYSMKWDSADSLNNIVMDYSIQKNDTSLLKNALFYSGWINLNKENTDITITQFLKLKTIAEGQNDNKLIQSCYHYISRAYLNKKDNENALVYAKKIPEYFIEKDTSTNAGRYNYIAHIYAQMNEVDSAMHYYNKNLSIIEDFSDYYRVSHVYNSISELLIRNNLYEEALRYVDLSLQRRTTRKDISFFNLTKARVFLATNQTDSAKIYLKIAIESSENDFISIAAYDYLSNLYKDEGDYISAYNQRQNMKSFFEKGESSLNMGLLTQKYQEEKLKNENNELKLAKREQEILFLAIAMVSIIVILALWIYLLGERKRKKIREQKLHEETLVARSLLVENENKLLKQENELISLREKSAILRESLFRNMSVAKKIPSLKITYEDDVSQTSGRISIEEPDWNELFYTVDDLFGGFASRLKKEYPNLSKEDIGFCCLVKINVSMQDLADIYCISKAGITKKKMRIKKDKFDIQNENLSLDKFLSSF